MKRVELVKVMKVEAESCIERFAYHMKHMEKADEVKFN